MEDSLTIGTKLRILRVSRNWSQDQIADKIEMTQAAYAKLESGQVKLTIDRAKKLAEAYEIEPEYFFATDFPIINYNNGPNSHGGPIQNYSNNDIKPMIELYEKLLQDKDEQIKIFRIEIEELRKEKGQLINLLDNFSRKS